jgi:hypothetical protein
MQRFCAHEKSARCYSAADGTHPLVEKRILWAPIDSFSARSPYKKSQDPLIEKRRIKKTLLLMDDAADNYIRVMLKRA